MATEKYTPRLKADYQDRIRALMTEKFGYTNAMQTPRLDKIVLNMGIGEAVADTKKANTALKDLTMIAGQKAVPTKARYLLAKVVCAGVRERARTLNLLRGLAEWPVASEGLDLLQ